jgi:hypothetical protein
VGVVRLWQLAREWAWLQKPWYSLVVLGLPGNVVLAVVGVKFALPAWLLAALLVGWPICAYLAWWAVIQKDARLALGTMCGLIVVFYWAGYAARTAYGDRYRDDSAFVEQACALMEPGKPVLILDDDAPLNASWLLFYVGERASLLHNVTFLLDEKITAGEAYLIARRKVEEALPAFGSHEVLLQSRQSRYEKTPADRYALFHLRFHDGLARRRPPRISPMQASGRAAGPYLTEPHVQIPPRQTWPTP